MAKFCIFLCLAFASYCMVSVQCRRQGNDLTAQLEAWLKEKHPEYYETIHNRLQKENGKHDPRQYFEREKTFWDLLRMAINEHGSKFTSMVETFLEKAQTRQPRAHPADVMATEAPLTCDSNVQCESSARSESSLIDTWRTLVESLNNPDSCDPCQLTFGGLQEMACSGPWEPWRDDIIQACEALFELVGVDPVLCNGTVTLQGQHLYCIAHEATPFEMCESLNQCYPRTVTAAVKPRGMPWEVKDELQPRLQRQIRAKERRRRSRRQNGSIRVLQLSDIHIQPKYAIGSPASCRAFICCLDNSLAIDGSKAARKWGEYLCNLPEATMRVFLEKVNEFNPDLILYTGDTPPHTLWDETLTSQLNCSSIMVNALKDTLASGTKVYPNIGNHEMYPTNLYSMRLPETTYMNQIFTKMWHGLAGLDEAANATFTDMSYYTVLHQPGLRILSMNTNYDWYPTNFYNTLNKNDSFNEEHKQFVENTLATARANDEKVIVLGHHPIGSTVIRAATWWEQVANEYGDVIVLHVSGHTHQDHQHLVIDPDTDVAKSVNLVTAITSTLINVNPSFRVFELDSTTFELLNFQSHAFNIDAQNPDVEPEIVLNYDAKQEYEMTDLSPASWQDLVLRMMDDDELFQTWNLNRFAKAEPGPCLFNDVCGEDCKKNQLCGIWFPRADQAATCVETWPPTVPPENPTEGPVASAISVRAGDFIVALVVLGHVCRRWG